MIDALRAAKVQPARVEGMSAQILEAHGAYAAAVLAVQEARDRRLSDMYLILEALCTEHGVHFNRVRPL